MCIWKYRSVIKYTIYIHDNKCYIGIDDSIISKLFIYYVNCIYACVYNMNIMFLVEL